MSARLVDALQDMLSGWKYIRSFHGDLYGVGWDRAQEKAEAALAEEAHPVTPNTKAALRLALAALEQSRPLATEDDFPLLVRAHDAAVKAVRAALDDTETPKGVAQSAKFPTDEELDAKGWQRVSCPACGSEMAWAAPPQPGPLPVPADSLMTHLQMQCSAWGTYWRASDAHGVNLTRAQATELLAYALGVEVEIKQ